MSADSLALRLSRSRTDLGRIVRDGPRERSYLPASDGLFLTGKRHLIAAPAKSGKSLAMLAHAVEMAHHGARVSILDRENGDDEYGRRLRIILAARGFDSSTAQLVTERIAHYNYPSLTLDAGRDPSYVEHFVDVDLVVFDSSRAFLTMLDLDEDSADDYSRFMAGLVDPLHRAGIASVILDNAGHDGRRARGSSAKSDLNEVVFSLTTTRPFSEEATGSVNLKRTHTRFGGGRDEWTMPIGGGRYASWLDAPGQGLDTARLDALVSILAEAPEPMSMNALYARLKGKKTNTVAFVKAAAAEPSSSVLVTDGRYHLGNQFPASEPMGTVLSLEDRIAR